MVPEFARFLLETPEADRQGPVFRLLRYDTGEPLVPVSVGRKVAEIGRLAGVVVNQADGKFASAHDLRRSFGTRWAPRMKPPTLQLLMRHRSIQTTLRYYVALDADDVAAELWAADPGLVDNRLANPAHQAQKPRQPGRDRRAQRL